MAFARIVGFACFLKSGFDFTAWRRDVTRPIASVAKPRHRTDVVCRANVPRGSFALYAVRRAGSRDEEVLAGSVS